MAARLNGARSTVLMTSCIWASVRAHKRGTARRWAHRQRTVRTVRTVRTGHPRWICWFGRLPDMFALQSRSGFLAERPTDLLLFKVELFVKRPVALGIDLVGLFNELFTRSGGERAVLPSHLP